MRLDMLLVEKISSDNVQPILHGLQHPERHVVEVKFAHR